MVKKTCGLLILSDTFKGPIFKNSFARLFDINDSDLQLNMAFNATLDVQTSRELKVINCCYYANNLVHRLLIYVIQVCGAIGHCTSLGKKGPSVAETEIGIGGTTAWKMCSLDPNVSIAVYFEVVNQVSI